MRLKKTYTSLLHIAASDLEDDMIGPILIEENRNQVTKRIKDEKYMDILGFYVSSVFQDFESYLRTEVEMVEDDIKFVLDWYNSSFVTNELEPGIYTFKGLSKTLFNILQPKYKLHNKSVDIK